MVTLTNLENFETSKIESKFEIQKPKATIKKKGRYIFQN